MTRSIRGLALPSLLLLSGCSLVFAPSNYSSGADLGAIDGGSTDLGLTDAPPSDLGGIPDDGATPDLGGDAGGLASWPQCDGLDRPASLVDVYGARVDVPAYLQTQWTGSSNAAFARLPNDFDLGEVAPGQTVTAVSIAADTDAVSAVNDTLYIALGGSLGAIRVLSLTVDALGARTIGAEQTLTLLEGLTVVDVSIAVQGSELSLAALAEGTLHVWTAASVSTIFDRPATETRAIGALRVAHAEMLPVYVDAAGMRTTIGTPPYPFAPSSPAVLIGSQGPLAFSRRADAYTAWSTRSGDQGLGTLGTRPQWLTGAYFLRAPTEGATRQHALLQEDSGFTLSYAGTTTCAPPAFTECITGEGLMVTARSTGYIVDLGQAGAHRRTATDPITDFIGAGTTDSLGSTTGTEVRVFPFVTTDRADPEYWNPEGIKIGSGTFLATGGAVGTLSDVESAVTSNSAGFGVFAVALVRLGLDTGRHAYLSGFRACATPP